MNYSAMYGEIVRLLSKDGELTYSVSTQMISCISLWSAMYENKPPWKVKRKKSANLSVQIASETARLVTLEMTSLIKGSQTADYLNEIYQKNVIPKLRKYTEYGLAKGSLIIKPIADENGIKTQFIQADRFFPISFDGSGNLIKCVFTDQIRKGKNIYTLIEIDTFENGLLKIENRLFKSSNDGMLGYEVALSEVPQWESLPKESVFSGVEKLPFGFFRCPLANQIDSFSPLGVSCYSRAVDLIEEADRRYNSISWEYEATETAVHISESMLKYNKDNDKFIYPGGNERLYRAVEYSAGANDKPLIETYSPQIRSTELFDGWNNQLRMIEYACCLAYGTLSNPQNVDKTAEEIRASKQRSYSFVADVQTALENALKDYIDGCWFWSQIFHLVPNGKYKVDFDWNDSIVSSPDEKRKQDIQDLNLGIMRPEEYRAKWYNEDIKTALENLPQSAEVIE